MSEPQNPQSSDLEPDFLPEFRSPTPPIGGHAAMGQDLAQSRPSEPRMVSPENQKPSNGAGFRPELSADIRSVSADFHAENQPNGVDPLSQIPWGVRSIGGYAVPEAFRFDFSFLSLPKDTQIFILQQITEGRLSVKTPTIVESTERHTVRLYSGQMEALENLAEKCAPYEEDRRRSLTANSLLREFLAVCLGVVAPHLDLGSVSTHEALRREIVASFQRAASTGFQFKE